MFKLIVAMTSIYMLQYLSLCAATLCAKTAAMPTVTQQVEPVMTTTTTIKRPRSVSSTQTGIILVVAVIILFILTIAWLLWHFRFARRWHTRRARGYAENTHNQILRDSYLERHAYQPEDVELNTWNTQGRSHLGGRHSNGSQWYNEIDEGGHRVSSSDWYTENTSEHLSPERPARVAFPRRSVLHHPRPVRPIRADSMETFMTVDL